MNFGFTDEQDLLRQEIRRVLDERCPIGVVRETMATEQGYNDALWSEMAALGWLGLMVPESYGGSGLTAVDGIVLFEETGRTLTPTPLLSNTLAANAIVENGSDAQKSTWLPKLCNGSAKATPALFDEADAFAAEETRLAATREGEGFMLSGIKKNVFDPISADAFVVSFRFGEGPTDVGLALVPSDASGVSAKSFPLIDETKRMGNLELTDVRVGPDQLLGTPGEVTRSIERLLDVGALFVTAEMSGAIDEAIRLTVEYAKSRIQFGHPIGHFQGVKHPLAEMYADLESFRSLLYYAGWLMEHRPAELSRQVSLAKAYATDSFVRTGIDSIQLHGAIGFTTACDIHLYFKRSKWARPAYGDADIHYERAFRLRGV